MYRFRIHFQRRTYLGQIRGKSGRRAYLRHNLVRGSECAVGLSGVLKYTTEIEREDEMNLGIHRRRHR